MHHCSTALLLLLTAVAAGFLLIGRCAFATIVLDTESVSDEGRTRYHYDDSVGEQCKMVMLIGVGTAMMVEDYDNLTRDVVTESLVVFIMMDQNGTKYAELAKAIVRQMVVLILACRGRPPRNGYIVSGQSAGGQAAIVALPLLLDSFGPVGFFDLDPSLMTVARNITFPGM